MSIGEMPHGAVLQAPPTFFARMGTEITIVANAPMLRDAWYPTNQGSLCANVKIIPHADITSS